MTSTLPPDPYAALGVPKDAPSATIKSTYRKLVLKCHPDKVTDPTLKQQKQEEFHKIQQAYELIGDEDRRQTYDAEVRLEQLRKEKAARAGPDVKTSRYPSATNGATYTSSSTPRYEERKPASASTSRYDDAFFEDRSRRYDTYEAYPSKPSSSSRSYRPEKESSRSTKPSSSDRTRSDHKKNRDKEDRRNRFDKYNPTGEDSSADEKMRYEKEFRRRSDDARRQEQEAAEKKAYAEARRKAEARRSHEDDKEPRRQRSDEREFDYQRKMEDFMGNAVRHIHNSKSKADYDRPSPARTSSSREIPRDYESRARRDRERERERERERPDPIRRSSAARPSHRPESSGRDRIEIVDWDSNGRSPPSFKHSTSSPPDFHASPPPPQRSYTERSHRRTETSPTPQLRRHETMPAPHSSSRRKEDHAPARPSNLRSSESSTPKASPPDHSFPAVPPASTSSTTKHYYYPTTGGGVALHPDDVKVANGRYTVLREPGSDRRQTRSPSPMRPGKTRPPMGENRPRDANYTTAPSSRGPPPLSRAATLNMADMERGRPRLFAEVSPDFARRPENTRKNSYSPDKVSYSKRYTPDDISWSRSSGRRDVSKDRDYGRPSLSRHATMGTVH